MAAHGFCQFFAACHGHVLGKIGNSRSLVVAQIVENLGGNGAEHLDRLAQLVRGALGNPLRLSGHRLQALLHFDKLIDRGSSVLPRHFKLLGDTRTARFSVLDQSVQIARGIAEAGQSLFGLCNGIGQRAIGVIGTGPDDFEQAHAVIRQAVQNRTAFVQDGAAFGKSLCQAVRSAGDLVTGIVGLRAQLLHVVVERGQAPGQRFTAFGETGDVGEMFLLPFGNAPIECSKAVFQIG